MPIINEWDISSCNDNILLYYVYNGMQVFLIHTKVEYILIKRNFVGDMLKFFCKQCNDAFGDLKIVGGNRYLTIGKG